MLESKTWENSMLSKKQKKSSRLWALIRDGIKQTLLKHSRITRSEAAVRRFNRKKGVLGDKFENAARLSRRTGQNSDSRPKMIGRKSMLRRQTGRGE